MKRFQLTKLNDVEGREQYHVIILNRHPALENLDDDVNKRAWETIIPGKEIIGSKEIK
jgi:hypothetical protein